MRLTRASAIGFSALGVAGLLTLVPDVAHAAIALPPECATSSDTTQHNIQFLTSPSFPINSTIAAIDGASNNIFATCGNVGVFIASALGTIETIWFVIQTVVLKHDIGDMLKDMLFKTMTVLTIIALVIGLSAKGGSLVKSFSFGVFTQLANNATSTIIPQSGSPIPSSVYGNPTGAIEGASNNIITDGMNAADAIVNCPANIYWNQHGGSNPAQQINNAVTYIAALPDEVAGWFVALLVIVVYGLIDMVLVATLLDGMIVLAVGVFTVGFANSRWTSDNASSYFKLMFSVGWKVFSYVFIGNFGVWLIDTTLSNILAQAQSLGNDLPALPIGGDLPMVIVILLIVVLMAFAGNISKALSSGSFAVGMGGAGVARALEIAYITSRFVGGGPAGVAGAAASRNGIAAAGNAAAGGGGGGNMPPPSRNGGGPSPVPPAPRPSTGSARSLISGVENHEVSAAGITFKPHG